MYKIVHIHSYQSRKGIGKENCKHVNCKGKCFVSHRDIRDGVSLVKAFAAAFCQVNPCYGMPCSVLECNLAFQRIFKPCLCFTIILELKKETHSCLNMFHIKCDNSCEKRTNVTVQRLLCFLKHLS